MSEIEKLQQEVKEMRKDIQALTEQIRKLTQTCGRMDNHIDFVDNVYETVRAPANYVLSRIGYGSTNLEEQKAIENFSENEQD
jgi:septal ring factor EnvC (AmiA/AmiB activator)